MKIYQIHEYGGQYEDAYDVIVGSYLSEERAKTEKKQLILKEKENMKCNSCPLYFCEEDCDYNCDACEERSIRKVKQYCKDYEPIEGEKCNNYYFNYEPSSFRIEEVNVIE